MIKFTKKSSTKHFGMLKDSRTQSKKKSVVKALDINSKAFKPILSPPTKSRSTLGTIA